MWWLQLRSLGGCSTLESSLSLFLRSKRAPAVVRLLTSTASAAKQPLPLAPQLITLQRSGVRMHVFLEALVVKSQWVNERGARADAKVVCRSSENESPLAAARRRALPRYPTFLVQGRKSGCEAVQLGVHGSWLHTPVRSCAQLPSVSNTFMQSPYIRPTTQLATSIMRPAVPWWQHCCPAAPLLKLKGTVAREASRASAPKGHPCRSPLRHNAVAIGASNIASSTHLVRMRTAARLHNLPPQGAAAIDASRAATSPMAHSSGCTRCCLRA